jgi:hypothetical protein
MRLVKILFITAVCGAISLVWAHTQVNELIQLKQSGVDDEVLIAYIQSSPNGPALTADDIVDLKNSGISNAVIAEALRHAHAAPAPAASTVESTAPQPQEKVDRTVFEESLGPYGNWIWIDGVRYWRPGIAAGNPDWAPYMTNGHWVYTDLGWTWVSDYPWGWAPFHYGRWWRHPVHGWVWWPDVTWGPAWVRWRTGDDFCGWAPLPPFSLFVPNHGFFFHGRFVDDEFEFGLAADDFFFVPSRHFCDNDVWARRVDFHRRHDAYNRTVFIRNNFTFVNGRVIEHGPPRDFVARATRTDIRPMVVESRAVDRPGPHFRGMTVSPGRMVVERPRVTVNVPLPLFPPPLPVPVPMPPGPKIIDRPQHEPAVVKEPRNEFRQNRPERVDMEKRQERKSEDVKPAPRQNERKQEGKEQRDRGHRGRSGGF